MNKLYALIGYAVAALVLAISIDVAARVGSSQPAAVDEEKAEAIARDLVEKLDEVAVVKASAASCEKLFVLQKETAVEMAVALSGKKQKKARRRIKREIEANMAAQHDDMLAVCMEIPQAEVDCVLGADDPAAWADCGPNITKIK
jgi:hypothetical protein